jgi:hypothetical protein
MANPNALPVAVVQAYPARFSTAEQRPLVRWAAVARVHDDTRWPAGRCERPKPQRSTCFGKARGRPAAIIRMPA